MTLTSDASAEVTCKGPMVNWSSFLDQVIRDYETPPAKGLAHALQKDAIQNGWGARDGKKKLKFEFLLLEPVGRPSVLTMRDSGTVGLIGDIYDEKTLPDPIPSDQRLARFECMFEPGEATGPGLFGRGKLVFNAASADRLIYYDSLTKTGIYRFGKRQIQGRKYDQFPRVCQGTTAHNELETRMGGLLEPLSQAGTRIIIVNPRSEIVEALRSGEFLKAIEETWWEIINKYDAEITVRIGDSPPARAAVPDEFGGLPVHAQGKKGWRVYYKENLEVAIAGAKHRIKRLHFLVSPLDHRMRPDLLGVNIHRKGMKIGDLRLSGVPQEIEDRLFGYIELEPNFEELLAGLENVTHYGFASLYKAPYKNLKSEVKTHFDVFMEQLGLRKGGVDPEQQTRRLLEEAQADLNNILHDFGVPGFGTGREPEGLLVSVEDLEFPGGSNYIRVGDRIAGFWYRVQNTSKNARSVWLEVYTYERDVGIIETLQSRVRIDIPGNGTHETKPFTINVVSSRYPRYKKVGCVCKMTDNERREVAKKGFFFYVDLEREEDEQEHAQIRLVSADWPRTPSRRVDYGEAIRNLQYEVENLSAIRMKARVKLRTLWAAEGNAPVADVGGWDVELSPFQSKVVALAELPVNRKTYQEIDRGKVNLRCHAAATENSRLWKKGDRLAEHTVSFLLNADPSYGFFEREEYWEGGPDGPRSEAQRIEAKSWKFRLNTTHPAYKATEPDAARRKDYFFEQMAKQAVYVLVSTEQLDVLRKHVGLGQGETLDDLSHEDVLQKVAFRFTDKILATYYPE